MRLTMWLALMSIMLCMALCGSRTNASLLNVFLRNIEGRLENQLRHKKSTVGSQCERHGLIPSGGSCGGHLREHCCGFSSCQTFSVFRRKYIDCPAISDLQECFCLLDQNAPVDYYYNEQPAKVEYFEPTPEEPKSACEGQIPQGEPCGLKQANCCGEMVCSTYNFKPCEPLAQMNDCICMPAFADHSWRGYGK